MRSTPCTGDRRWHGRLPRMDVRVGDGTPGVNARLVDVGEFGLIERVFIALTETGVAPDPEHGVLVGPGDDAAGIAAPGGRGVVSTAVPVAGRHCRRDWPSA